MKRWFVCTKQPQGIASPITSVEESLVQRARGEKPLLKNSASSEATHGGDGATAAGVSVNGHEEGTITLSLLPPPSLLHVQDERQRPPPPLQQAEQFRQSPRPRGP